MKNYIVVKFFDEDDLGCCEFTGIVLTSKEVWEKSLKTIEKSIKNDEFYFPLKNFDDIYFNFKGDMNSFLECIEIDEVEDQDAQIIGSFLSLHQVFGVIPFLDKSLIK